MNRDAVHGEWVALKGILLGLWCFAFLISLNHLYPYSSTLCAVSTHFVGGVGWLIASLAVLVLSRGHGRQTLSIVLLFFSLGFVIGPFLEPPADPLEHLRRVHEESCGKTVEEVAESNRGLWQYSMVGTVLCVEADKPVVSVVMLRWINIVNGMFWALGSAVLFILALQAGLPPRWAFFSVLTCFLFLGTNRFSYFRYYSLAPSFSSLCVYWIWIALFFFKRKNKDIAKGVIFAISAVPILWVNHIQEAIFIVFIVLLWLALFFVRWADGWLHDEFHKYVPGCLAGVSWVRIFFALFLMGIFWLLPQSISFLHWFSQFFPLGKWPHYHFLAVNWNGLYIGGKIFGVRIMDTQGWIILVSALLAIPYFSMDFFKREPGIRGRLFILAVLPFIVYFTPLIHFVWASNVRTSEYYRFCYASVFWLFFADFFMRFEAVSCNVFSGISKLLSWK